MAQHSQVHTEAMPRVKQRCGIGGLLGESASMQVLFEQIRRVAPTRSSVLIVGESGTGKEMIARCLHRLSASAEGPFLVVSCSAIPAAAIESEIFGHEKTNGASGAHIEQGCLERAAGGTVLLDEIADLPADVQTKLLRALECGRMVRVGGSRESELHCRIIAATECDPQRSVTEGRLRSDFLSRIAVFAIAVPPLRDRGNDGELLAQHHLAALNAEEHTEKYFSAAALACIRRYAWPGNVRELHNTVQRAFLLADAELDIGAVVGNSPISAVLSQQQTLRIPVGTSLADAERWMIIATLRKCGGNKTRAAALLGVSLKTLYNRLNAYRAQGMDVSDFDSELMEVPV